MARRSQPPMSPQALRWRTPDASLLSNDLFQLPHLIGVSKKSIRTIRQNIVFAVGSLLIAVCLTTAGIQTPVTGTLLHELSSDPGHR